MYTRAGIHELKHVPNGILKDLNPQIVVTAGTYEHADAINRHRARVQELVNLLPNAIIGVRWWPDDNILDRMTPAEYASAFFPLHVPGSVLFVGNEDNNSHVDPSVTRRTIAKHIEVLKLATAARIPIGTCCFSTGNPNVRQYDLFEPLFAEMHRGRQAGVVSWLRINRYYTPSESGHVYEHEALFAALERRTGVPTPPVLYGEIGPLRSYFEPEEGWRSIPGMDETAFVDRLAYLNVRHPHAVYCYGVGIYDERWAKCAVNEEILSQMTKRLPRTAKTAYEEWKAKQVTTTPQSPVTYKDGVVATVRNNYVNVRRETDVLSAADRRLYPGDAIRYNPVAQSGGVYTISAATGEKGNLWYKLENGGYVAASLLTISETVSDKPIKSVPVPYESQLDPTANLLNNDCPEANILMGIHFWHLSHGLPEIMQGLTINMLTRGRKDLPADLNYVVSSLKVFGVYAEYKRPLTPDAIIAEINNDRPVIALLNYYYIGGQRFGHYAMIRAYGERGFWMHDPYLKGADTYITRDNLEKALTDLKGADGMNFASFPYQGVVFK